MRSFGCGHCGQLLFFENSLCLRCGTRQGFASEALTLIALDATADPAWRKCVNAGIATCNWLLGPGEEHEALCRSCRLTRTRPDDDDEVGMAEFRKAEAAKRRLLYQLFELELPVDESRLCFDLLSSARGPVTTGHADGVITLDLAESDDVARAQRRAAMGEPYRTLLGHFRHEIAHYYQPILVSSDDEWERCRALFGDERESYQDAIDRHYASGPPEDWERRHVSAYATMHAWEDWAETFAHYLHIRDTLQTAGEYGLVVLGPARAAFDDDLIAAPVLDADEEPFAEIVESWLPLTYALNQVNRSMGVRDLYPFTLAGPVVEKLAYVHERVRAT